MVQRERRKEAMRQTRANLEKIIEERTAQHRALEEKYQDLYDNAPDMYVSVDAETAKIRECNQTLATRLGYSKGEIIGRPIFDMYHPDCMVDVEKAFHTFVTTGEVHDVELQLKRKDGSKIDVSLNVTSVRDAQGRILSSRSAWRDISERKQVEAKMRISEERFGMLVGNIPGATYQCACDEHWTMKFISDGVEEISGYPATDFIDNKARSFASIIYPDDVVLVDNAVREGIRNDAPYSMEYRILDAQGKTHWVLERGRGVLPADKSKVLWLDGVILDISDRKRIEDTQSEEVLKAEKTRKAMLFMLEDMNDSSAALAKSKQELEVSHGHLKKSLEGTISAISMAVEARDPYTAGHQHRVADLASAIAHEMGFGEDQTVGIRMGATIHDIGKIHLPAEILSKPAKLTDIEYSLVQSHPQVGYDILKNVDFPWPVADIAYQHHERMDGSGYPQGLKDEEICIEARIVAVADVVEAMASHRPYRPALGIESALEEVKSNRGTFFDPQVVDACVSLFAEKGFSFDESGADEPPPMDEPQL